MSYIFYVAYSFTFLLTINKTDETWAYVWEAGGGEAAPQMVKNNGL